MGNGGLGPALVPHLIFEWGTGNGEVGNGKEQVGDRARDWLVGSRRTSASGERLLSGPLVHHAHGYTQEGRP